MRKLRLQITKEKDIRFISHLEYLRTVERSFRRAALPVAYSEGFNPHIKFSLASALGVGVVSYAEYVEVLLDDVLSAGLTPLAAARQLVRALPRGIRVRGADIVPQQEPALMSVAGGARYRITVPYTGAEDAEARIQAALGAFNSAPELHFFKDAPKTRAKVRDIDVKAYISRLDGACAGGVLVLQFDCRITPTGSMKPSDVVRVLNQAYALDLPLALADIERLDLYRVDARGRRKPMIRSKATEAEIYEQ